MKQLLLVFILLSTNCCATEFPDLGGVLDFSEPEKISNQLFILTNPKSGSHLLLYSLMKITKRPMRGRIPYWHFENDPGFDTPENMMGYSLDFTKPTTYWGHEYHILKTLNHGNNKLVFIMRNYKENVMSLLYLNHKKSCSKEELMKKLGNLLKEEVLNEGMIFKEYMIRLDLFDTWSKSDRCLVQFEHLTSHPEIFVPQMLSFIGDNSDYLNFVQTYGLFKEELRKEYSKKLKDSGSGCSQRYFSEHVSEKTLRQIDKAVKRRYPKLWKKYLKKFAS